MRKLKHLGLASNSTVILRQHSNAHRGSLYALANARSVPSSEAESTALSEESVLEDPFATNTSGESRHSVVISSHDNARRSGRRYFHPWTRSSPDFTLNTIRETGTDQAQPTIKTVEKAAAAKIYIETHLNEKLHRQDPRIARRQYLETQLFYSPHLTETQKDAVRVSFLNQETCHLRETRALISRSLAACNGKKISPYVDDYEPLKILGKGSFGVVRLVREKSVELGPSRPKQVFAMKVIRKSDMLRSSQEGHLRAERDFLVSSEGAQW